jgi:hypothetical protein
MKRSGRNPSGRAIWAGGRHARPDPTWQALYRAALVEADPIKLNGRIEAARWSIRQRLEQIEDSDTRERQQLNDALGALFTLVARKRSA